MTPGQPSPYTPQTPGATLDVLGQSVRIKLGVFFLLIMEMYIVHMLFIFLRIGIRLI